MLNVIISYQEAIRRTKFEKIANNSHLCGDGHEDYQTMSPKKSSRIFVIFSLTLSFMSFSGSAAATEQSKWLEHETASCAKWRQANLYDAITEGKEACRLAPDNLVALLNLGLMLQATEDYDAAIACYDKAGKINPAHYLPYLGTARCWIMRGEEAKGIKILTEMSLKKDAGFDWYYAGGQTSLKIKQNELAESFFTSAMSAASTVNQRSDARNSLFLIELRSNKLEQARELYKKVLTECPPKTAEPYVRAAATLLKTEEPAQGKELLSSTAKNLTTIQDADAFFQLGRIFQERAREAAAKSDKDSKNYRVSWLAAASDSYTRAIDLAPKEADYRLARADVLMQEGKLSEMVADLKVAKELSPPDPLPSFVVDNLTDNTGKGLRMKPTKLVKAKLTIVGLSCDCHLSKFLGTMRNIKGVAFIAASGRKVFLGEIIYAPSIMPVADLIEKTKSDFFKAMPPMKSATPLSVEVTEEKPIANLDDVFKLACDARRGPILSYHESLVDFYNRFNDIKPSISIDGSMTAGAQEGTNVKI